MGKELGSENVLKGAMDMLDKEIQPVIHPPDATPKYRKTLAKSTLYKVGHYSWKFMSDIRWPLAFTDKMVS